METEVLAPAGSIEGLKAALYAGADAVYTGGRMFGARAYANNLSDEELSECIDYCHLHNKKIYLTTNTLMKQSEIYQLADWLVPFYEQGLDAVIVQDFGAFAFLKREFPNLDLHASTQMSVHSVQSAALLEKLGASRVVPAREISLEEIAAIRQNTSLEIECFVHGALCYCYSGQCLMSSMIGGRSGNRGRCAQPCRLPYVYEGKEQFWLSPKDICTLQILPEVLEAGVEIEGRMKRTEYAAGVAAMYRKYVDLYRKNGKEGYHVEKKDIQDLMDLYNRGGFSTGYYQRYHGVSMMSMKRQNHYGTEGAMLLEQRKGGQLTFKALENLQKGDMLESATVAEDVKKGRIFSMKVRDAGRLQKGGIWNRTYNAKLMEGLKEKYIGKILYEKIKGKLMIFKGKPAILTVTYDGPEGRITASQSGAIVQAAQKQPIAEERVRKQMMRTGNSPYLFEHLQVVMDEECFLPMQSFNELRRGALEALQEKQLQAYQRKSDKSGKTGENSPEMEKVEAEKSANDGKQEKKAKLSVSIERADLFEEMLQIEGVKRIYLDSKCFLDFRMCEQIPSMAQRCQGQKKELWYIFPSLFRTKDQELWDQQMKQYMTCFDGMMVKNPEQIAYLEQIGYDGTWAADYNVYAYNKEAKAFLRNLGCSFFVCPAELTFKELKERDCDGDEMLVYGRIPVMTSTQCLKKSAGHCQKTPDLFKVRDRKGKEFPVKNCCSYCYNVIYNSVPVSLHGWSEEVRKCSPASVRLAFTTESNKEAAAVAKRFVKEYLWGEELGEPGYEFTRGHYKRGVE